MTNIILCGGLDDKTVTNALIPTLTYYGGVRYSAPDRIMKCGVSEKFALYEYESIPKVELSDGIILLKTSIRQTKGVTLPSNLHYVMESKNLRAAALLNGMEASVVTCGTGRKDTLSIAGLQSSNAALSLQRTVETVDGRLLEPHDFTVDFSEKRSPHQLLLISAALLLSGIDSAKGYHV